MSRVDTSKGKGGGQLTESPAPEAEDGGIRPRDVQPAPFTGQMEAEEPEPEARPSQDQQG